MNKSEIIETIAELINTTPIYDIHTHLFPKSFPGFALYGLDNLLNYHYLIAEYFRTFEALEPEVFFGLSKEARSEIIWNELFVMKTPLSEATIGVIDIFNTLGIDSTGSYEKTKESFKNLTNRDDYFEFIFKKAGVSKVVMTNDPLNEEELSSWNNQSNQMFDYALRLDSFVNFNGRISFQDRPYHIPQQTSEYLIKCIEYVQPRYFAISLSHEFNVATKEYEFLDEVVFPICKNKQIPISLMIGVTRQVNPAYELAGDGVLEKADVSVLTHLCARNPDVKFLVTYLSRENQYELTVLARKFPNLMPFGIWWFLNIPELINEITEMRMSLLGNGFIPQHSDARILEQLIYKWGRFRSIFTDVLTKRYLELYDKNVPITKDRIQLDINSFFQTNFQNFIS
ncbi:MAG: glucuronate isomerase [Flavobacteriaceae bacterium]|nr:glucuronate isomerase [Flavobacteriaceae bacterium]